MRAFSFYFSNCCGMFVCVSEVENVIGKLANIWGFCPKNK